MAQAFLHTNTATLISRSSTTSNHRHPRFLLTCSSNQSSSYAYWDAINTQIDAHLKHSIPIRPPLVVFEPMHHLAFSAPKNTASALCVAASDIVGGHRDQAIMAAASALHLMHAATHVHEHLPLTDRSPNSVNKSRNINHVFDPNIELLTSDGFIPFGFELLAAASSVSSSSNEEENNAGRILRVIAEIAGVMGSQGIIVGQYQKFLHYQQTHENDDDDAAGDVVNWIDEVIKRTEGELHACGAACGAILGGGNEDEIEKLRKYGLYAGMIQGTLYGGGDIVKIGDKRVRGKLDELREMALAQLKGFDKTKVETISTLLDAELCVNT